MHAASIFAKLKESISPDAYILANNNLITITPNNRSSRTQGINAEFIACHFSESLQIRH